MLLEWSLCCYGGDVAPSPQTLASMRLAQRAKNKPALTWALPWSPQACPCSSSAPGISFWGRSHPPFPDEPEEKASSVLEIRPEGQMTLEINLQTDNPARGWNLCRGQGGRRPNRSEVACFGVQGQTGWIPDSVGLRKGSRAEVNPSLHVKPYSNPRSNKDAWLNGSFICTTNNILV